MSLKALKTTLKSRRFWIWQIAGATIYAIPAIIRLITGEVTLPILSQLATPWIDHYVPANLIEKILVNAFFPGGSGAVAGEILYTNTKQQTLQRKQKYLARLAGALAYTGVWSLFQLWGNMQNITGSFGSNLFEYPSVYPLNFLLGALSIFTPDIVGFIKNKTANAYRRLKHRKNPSAKAS